MAKRSVGIIPTNDGRYVQIWDDGSQTIYDQYFNVVQDDPTPNPQRAAAFQSGDETAIARASENASTESRRRFGEEQQRQKEQIAIQEMVARGQISNQEGQLALARARLGLDTELGRGNLALGQARLGLDTLSEAARLRGPENYFQEADFVRGAGQRQDIPMFLQGRQADFQVRGGDPNPVSLQSISNRITGGVGAPAGGVGSPGGQDEMALNAIRTKAMNPHNQFAAGEWESWTPDEQKLFLSGVGKAGMSESGFLTQLRRSRIGQGIVGSRAA